MVTLIGVMGAGKSEVGGRLAARLEAPFVDVDEVIVTMAGRPIAEVFAEHGEKRFRAIEKEALAEALSSEGAVVASGGGAILDPVNVERIRSSGPVVYLQVGPETARARVGDGSGRPLLAATNLLERLTLLIAERDPLYRAACDHVVDAEADPDRVVAAIVEVLS